MNAKKVIIIVAVIAGVLLLLALIVAPNVMDSMGGAMYSTAKDECCCKEMLPNCVPGESDIAGPEQTDPLNTEEYTEYKINDFVDTKDSAFSTFATDVDTASYTVMRSKIKGGQLPPAESVRVEEYLNYFDYNYPAPKDGLFTVYGQIADNPFNNGETKLMRVALKAKEISKQERRTAHLTFLVDTSGSMQDNNKLPLVIETLKTLVNNLRTDDTIAICTYAGRVDNILEPTRVRNKKEIISKLERLRSGGSTAGESGLKNAYRLANACFVKGDINRIIMCTDGDFNVGETDGKTIAEAVNHYARSGITFSAVGYGIGNYKDDTLESLADAGNGNYFYIDSEDEINKVFGEDLGSTLDVVAADTKIQIEFNPNIISKFRLIGYENRALTKEQFRQDIVDAGDIGAGHSVTAIYEIIMNDGNGDKIEVTDELANLAAIFRIRYKINITDEEAVETAFPIENNILKFDNASKSFKFAAGIMGFADILRNSDYSKNWKINTAIDCCKSGIIKSVDRAKELIDLMRKAISLRDSSNVSNRTE